MVRLNLSHGTHDEHRKTIQRVRRIALDEAVHLPVVLDLMGPRYRLGKLPGERRRLQPGEEVRLGAEGTVGVDLPLDDSSILAHLEPGERLLIDGGLLELRVEECERDRVRAAVVHGGEVRSRKGLNLPDTNLPFEISDKDRRDCAFALAEGADYLAASYVGEAAHVEALREVVRGLGGRLPIIAKLERATALDHLDEITTAADGVMVARGDLGVEIGPAEVPLIQKRIILKALERWVPVITATQMLETMVHAPEPTRAEASDVANAILDGTSAIMLSGETAVGRYPVESVQTMDRIARAVLANPRVLDVWVRVAKTEAPLPEDVEEVAVEVSRSRDDLGRVATTDVKAIADEVETIVKHPDFAKRTIGVVSLIGGQQAHFIQQLLLERIGEEAFHRHKIACGDSATFQGKERDIMFVSMVSSPGDGALASQVFQQRFNVALSRARDRMYLFRSVAEEHLKNLQDLRLKVIRHFKQPMPETEQVVGDLIDRCESGFERDVFTRLAGLGYCVTPQVGVGSWRIDLVVEGENDRRLAVELDGDKWHPPENWLGDMFRQRAMELELQDMRQEVPRIRVVGRHVILGSRNEELFPSRHHRRHALILRAPVPPGSVVIGRRDRS